MWLSQPKISKDNRTWLYFCVSVLFLTLFPALGALGLVTVLVIVWRDHYHQIVSSSLNRGLGVLTALLILSTVLARYSQEAWLGLANFLPYFALFITLRLLITKPIQLRQLAWLLILPSLLIVILGLGQLYAAWDSPVFLENILGWELVPLGVPPGRMSAVFIYANFLAIYLAIAFTLTIGLWCLTWQQKSARLKTPTLFLLSLILLADITGLILTSSRNAWGLAIFSFMAYAVYFGWQWLVWGVTGAATTILWASFVPNLGGTQLRQVVPAFIWQRLSDQLYDRPVETLRLTQWQFCWDLIQQRPLWGWGLRNFTPLYEAKFNLWLGHPHNLFFMFGAEAGIIALVCLLALIGNILLQGVKLLTSCGDDESRLILFSYLVAFSACIIFNLTDVTVFDLRINAIAWIILAAISGITSTTLKKDEIN
ncbi:MAG: O-antigen ligase family protein [Cyanobacteria bacterium P01_C01_bin.72]